MSEIVGVDLKPTEETSLSDMIETGIAKMVEQLEEISTAATKEFQLEKNLEKMQEEWKDMKFDIIPYKWGKLLYNRKIYLLFFLR